MSCYECNICLECDSKCNFKMKSCDHRFHAKCIQKWLETNNTCPICRKKVYTFQSQTSLYNQWFQEKQNEYEEILTDVFNNVEDNSFMIEVFLIHSLKELEKNFSKIIKFSNLLNFDMDVVSYISDIEDLYDHFYIEIEILKQDYLFRFLDFTLKTFLNEEKMKLIPLVYTF